MSLVLACDLGGSSFRAAVVDICGNIRFLAAAPSPPIRQQGLAAEIDPEAWWEVFVAAVDRLAGDAGAAFDDIAAIAVTGVTRTQVFVGADGAPLRAAMTWSDRRAQPLLEEIGGLEEETGDGSAALNAFHPAARLLWLARNEPEIAARVSAVLEPKDFLNARLTGRIATDEISSARLLEAARSASGKPSMLDRLGIDGAVIPETVAPTTLLWPVRSGLPGALGRLEGRPVMAMAHDSWAAVLGLGALRDGYAYNLSGTTEVFGAISAETVAADGLMSVDWGAGGHQIGGPSLCGGDTLRWALDLLGRGVVESSDVDDEIERLLAQPLDPQPLIFLPYLRGERTPYWDPDLRGALIGLGRGHGAGDIINAVMVGIACLNRIVLERAETAIGREVAEIRFGGGGAMNARWRRIKADMCGRDVVVTESGEPGLIGGAIVAFAALGEVASLAEGQQQLVRVQTRVAPDPARAGERDRLFGIFKTCHDALAPIGRELSSWPDLP